MSNPEHIAEVRRWLRYAREDLTSAEYAGVVPRQACFLAQQSAEKALKGTLVLLQITFPYTHDLDLLLTRLPPDWQVKSEYEDLAQLSVWAVLARYPTSLPDPTDLDAQEAIRQARAVWNSVRRDLRHHGFDPD
jgi:HEPN domain-containing protein